MVTLVRLARLGILDGVRAVAKTCKPRSWKAPARAAPMPPSLQPVMRTDLGPMGVGWSLGVWDILRKVACSEDSRPRCDGQATQGVELGLTILPLLSGCLRDDINCRILFMGA